ncbi:hypothetical protein EZS27_023324 [termite gut metagenome]|uniref:DUF4959 domain-containing protein n=1 Tax=termite gut metagenome TaxID=433724 RepID=A0A5J4R1Y1_9ZZZZ
MNTLHYTNYSSFSGRLTVLALLCLFLISFYACKESGRFEINSEDTVPPAPPTLKGDPKPLNGGARIYYSIPDDEDLLSVDAEYTSVNGKVIRFSASYFKDSLDVYGLNAIIDYTIQLYAVDRSGNKSVSLPVQVKPLESAIMKVAKTISVKSSFSSFFIDWKNELQQDVNVYVDFSFIQNGSLRSLTSVFSSNSPEERRFVNDLNPQEPVTVQVSVGDMYENRTSKTDAGQLHLLSDELIPKDHWLLPATNDSIGDIPQCFGNNNEGRLRYVIDGIIDMGISRNYLNGNPNNRTGLAKDGHLPWNVIIDLGDYYELSRIVTHQRHGNGNLSLGADSRGNYYQGNNVGRYKMYILDEETEEWEYVSQHTIPIPAVQTELDFFLSGQAGDMAYMYPDEPQYTRPVRWFRYEALNGFGSNYTSTACDDLSEITLYGRKVQINN